MFLHYIEPIHTHIACILTSPDRQFIHKWYNQAEWIIRIQFYETFKKIYRSGFSMWAPSKIFMNVLKCFGNYLNTQMDLSKSQEISYAHFVFCCGSFTRQFYPYRLWLFMSSNGNISRVTDHLCGEFTDNRRITRTMASDADLVIWDAIVPIMTSL